MYRVTRSTAVIVFLAFFLCLSWSVLYQSDASETSPPGAETGQVTSFGSKVLLVICGIVGGALLALIALIALIGVKPKGHVSPPPPLPPKFANPLDNGPWLKLVEECVALVDELDRHTDNFDPAQRELAEHVIWRVQEILDRCSVQTIMNETIFDRNRHQPASSGGNIVLGVTIAETLSPGFVVANRVLRRARVLLTTSHPPPTDP